MTPVVTEEELKSLKLFSYYLQSHGIKKAEMQVYIEDCGVGYMPDNAYGDGGHAELYDAIRKTLEDILENNELHSQGSDCENRGNLNFFIDCVERTLEAEYDEYVQGTNEMSDSKYIDDDDLDGDEKVTLRNQMQRYITNEYYTKIRDYFMSRLTQDVSEQMGVMDVLASMPETGQEVTGMVGSSTSPCEVSKTSSEMVLELYGKARGLSGQPSQTDSKIQNWVTRISKSIAGAGITDDFRKVITHRFIVFNLPKYFLKIRHVLKLRLNYTNIAFYFYN